ncbi:1,6-anhydro-N-acetylmuramyl-L-alanine amidase AmpD [uncultured Psychrosphaera sp.]|jgi:AmpD protein|uniref:1,6-anhydro-N-acetylmuramyl-L-alanine amidase AmpD n=1 Tax=uncultured Psychrosphaera sp. TaxID=1403522 RepID=UPI0026206657|nr:1,6-anhydro-N-acetylmuramyl-L-alanine amidase AmpD [uncultured Psychrosphaera sp.]
MPNQKNKLSGDLATQDVWLENVTRCETTHCDDREGEASNNIDLLVIHNISLPPAETEDDFNNNNVEQFFTGQLDSSQHPYFASIAQLRVSAHLYIKRTGQVIQFVPLNKRAWHAGVSEFNGKQRCNDFSIGIELQGTDVLPYTDLQYAALQQVSIQIQALYPDIVVDNIVGHCDIAPGRKTDPGFSFDWTRYKGRL